MKYLFLSLAMLLTGLVSNVARADEIVEVQKRYDLRVNELISIEIKPSVEKVTWTVLPPNVDGQAKLTEIFREFDPATKNIKLRFIAYQEGTYFLSIAAANGVVKQYISTIVAGPPGPQPQNDYDAAIVSAWQREADANKLKMAASLSDVYGFASVLTENDMKTVGDFWKLVESFETKSGTNVAVKFLHAAIDSEKNRQFTEAATVELTPDLRNRLKTFSSHTSAAIKKAIGTVPPPPPPPPPPVDAFADSLKAAFAAETSATKQAELKGLASVYRDGQRFAATEKTWGNLFAKMGESAKTAGANGKLLGMQKIIAVELSSRLPTNPQMQLDATLATATFERIATILESIK